MKIISECLHLLCRAHLPLQSRAFLWTKTNTGPTLFEAMTKIRFTICHTDIIYRAYLGADTVLSKAISYLKANIDDMRSYKSNTLNRVF